MTTDSSPFENIEDPAKESEQIKEIASLTVDLLEMRYERPKKVLRGVHPKAHGCVRAIFEVASDLDPELQIGVFSKPGRRYDAWIRFSNASPRIEHDLKDGKSGSRGMAIKLLGVDGDVLLDDGGASSQDFLMINTPVFAFANVPDYLRLTKVILEHDDDPTFFFASLKGAPGFTPAEVHRTGRTFQIVQQILVRHVANPLEVQYFSAAPFAFGPDRVMKYSAEPVGGEKPQVLPENPSENYLREALLETLSKGEEVHFDFKIQVRRGGEGDLGIEDATSEWDEATTPFVNVAKLTIVAPQTDLETPPAMKSCEELVFSPWHSVPAHLPLGSINRLRKEVYIASSERRTPGWQGRSKSDAGGGSKGSSGG